MKSPFDAIALRRAALVEEIGIARDGLAIAVQGLRKELAWASLGLMLSQLLGRKRWVRVAGLTALAVSLGSRLLARFFPARR
jgi:hypothetical protein